MNRLKIALALLFIFAWTGMQAATYSLKSPDGKLETHIDATDTIAFSIYADGKPVAENIAISMVTNKGTFGKDSKIAGVRTSSNDVEIKNPHGVASRISDKYNQLEIDFTTFKLVFRAYDESIAYRFVANLGDGKMDILSEELKLPVLPEDSIITQFAEGNLTHFEYTFTRAKISETQKHHSLLLPVLIKKNNKILAVVESDVQDYPMLRFKKGKDDSLSAYMVKLPKTFKSPTGFHKHIKLDYDTFENCIARTSATRSFPWRAFIVARTDADLAVNTTVYKLAEPSRLKDTSWISTGLCVWEWWHNWSLEGVDFETGVNEATYRYYIDFAADNNIPYILFDAGWLTNRAVWVTMPDIHEKILEKSPYLNVKKVIEYAHSKNVKVILWCLGQTLNLYGDKAIPLMKSYGADGLKVDFFDRDDQKAMELHYRIAKIAAENKLLVDFHGCAKPAGLQRTYPNVVNFEGVRGLEWNKGTDAVTPSHDVDLVMTRMLQGPMDYTPGAMRNVSQKRFKPNAEHPLSMGTRSHQVALYVLFHAPVQMLCDSPTEYNKYPQTLKFIASIPTTWDESKAIAGKLGEYVVVARRKGDVWYVAGICDNKGKDFTLKLSDIVSQGDYAVEIFRDTINNNMTPQDYKVEKKTLSDSNVIKLDMKRGGGFVVRITPEKFSIFSKFIRTIFDN